MKEVKNKAFLTYYDNEVMYRLLSNEDAGKLIKAMFRFCKDGELVLSEKDGLAYGYFEVLKSQFIRDEQKYVQQALKKKERDAKRYEQKKKGTGMAQKIKVEEVDGDDNVNNVEPF